MQNSSDFTVNDFNAVVAFIDLYDKYSAPLYGVIIRKVSSPDLAKILLQRVYVEIFKEIRHQQDTPYHFITIYREAIRQIKLEAEASALV